MGTIVLTRLVLGPGMSVPEVKELLIQNRIIAQAVKNVGGNKKNM